MDLRRVLAGVVAGPAVHGHLGHFKVVPQGKVAEHREAPEERSEVPLDDLLGALALELLGLLYARFHGHRLRPRDVGGVTGNVRIATPDTPRRDTNTPYPSLVAETCFAQYCKCWRSRSLSRHRRDRSTVLGMYVKIVPDSSDAFPGLDDAKLTAAI
jgi:hypothetical protein